MIKGQESEVAAANLLSVSGSKVSSLDVRERLLSHPNYPSLLALSDVLKDLGLEASAAQVPPTQLHRVTPAILYTGEGYVVATEVEDSVVKLLSPERLEIALPLSELRSVWTGVCLYTEGDYAESARATLLLAKARQVQRARRMRASLVVVAVALFVALAAQVSLEVLAWAASACLGLTASLALVGVEVGQDLGLGRFLCPVNAGQPSGCRVVLDSPGSTLLGVKASYLGCAFFVLQLACLLVVLSTDSPVFLGVLAGLVLPTIGYVLFSCVYQAFVIRQWCRLCLLVQSVLVFQFVLSVTNIELAQAVLTDKRFLPLSVLLFLLGCLVLLGLSLLIPELSEAKKGRESKLRLEGLMAAPQRISESLRGSKEVVIGQRQGDIVVGDTEAGIEIAVLLSFDCVFCASAFEEVRDLLIDREKNVSMRLRFAGPPLGKKNDEYALGIMSLVLEGKTQEALDALDRYYRRKKPIRPREIHSDALRALQGHALFCQTAGVDAFPRAFVNGRQLADARISSLRYWLRRMGENQ